MYRRSLDVVSSVRWTRGRAGLSKGQEVNGKRGKEREKGGKRETRENEGEEGKEGKKC